VADDIPELAPIETTARALSFDCEPDEAHTIDGDQTAGEQRSDEVA